MCPRPINAKKVPVIPEFEDFITPKIVDEAAVEKENKSVRFYIPDDDVEENFSSDDDCSETEYDLSDSDLGGRLIALNFSESNAFSRQEKDRYATENSLIVESTQSQASDQEQFNAQTALSERAIRSALKMPDLLANGSKKSVRFADSVGLDLVHVKLFKSDNEDCDLDQLLPLSTTQTEIFATWKTATSTKTRQQQLLMHFPQRKEGEINQIVEEQNVCIESVNCKGTFVSGLIQVKDIAFDEQVRLRYTLDGWGTYAEVPCIFMSSSTADNRDSFTFSFCLPLDLPVGGCCEMCASYKAADQTYWDNNNGENYKLDWCPLSNGHIDHSNLQPRTQ